MINYKYILAYRNPHTGDKVKILFVTFPQREIEALEGQGVTEMGCWFLESWQSHGKYIYERWQDGKTQQD